METSIEQLRIELLNAVNAFMQLEEDTPELIKTEMERHVKSKFNSLNHRLNRNN